MRFGGAGFETGATDTGPSGSSCVVVGQGLGHIKKIVQLHS